MKSKLRSINQPDDVETRIVSLKEMVEAMGASSDDDTFRWFQTSYAQPDGSIHHKETLRVTMRQARAELDVVKK